MKPNELYAMTSKEEIYELYYFSGYGYNYLEETGLSDGELHDAANLAGNSHRIKTKCYENYCYDGRRIWRLASNA